MKSKNKARRYQNLVKQFSNWPQYLWFKTTSYPGSFDFRLRNSFSVRVPRQMLSAFRECFFDQIYLKYFPAPVLDLSAPVVVDIGANAGFFSLFMFYRYPNARVYSFEPMPFNYQLLKGYQTTYSSFDWHTDARAVSDTNQSIALHASKLDGYTTMASVFDSAGDAQRIEVESVTLPQIKEAYGLDRIDVLKLDCEGSEYSILYSLPPKLLTSVKVLVIETHQGSRPQENLPALKAYLEQNGFLLRYLDEGKSGYLWAWR